MAKIDPLSVQVAFKVLKPKGVDISRKALNELYLHWVETGELPRNITIRGIFWKNSNRREPLNFWRYSSYSDISVLVKDWENLTPQQKKEIRKKRGIESEPRGHHEEARTTLQNALRTFRPF